MKRIRIEILLYLILIICCSSCKNQCDDKAVCVKITKHIENNILELCISIKNNTNKNIYLNPGSWFFSVKKENNGITSDAIDEAYSAMPHSGELVLELRDLSKPKKSSKCGEFYLGPLYQDSDFRVKVTNELFNHISDSFRSYAINNHFEESSLITESKFSDKNKLDNMICQMIYLNMDCLFIPAKKEIITHWPIDLTQIQFDKLYLQFVYPSNFRYFYYANLETTSLSEKNALDSCSIDYPQNLLDYELFRDSIKSDVIVINNPYK